MRGPPLHGQPRQLAPRCVLPPPHPGWRTCARACVRTPPRIHRHRPPLPDPASVPQPTAISNLRVLISIILQRCLGPPLRRGALRGRPGAGRGGAGAPRGSPGAVPALAPAPRRSDPGARGPGRPKGVEPRESHHSHTKPNSKTPTAPGAPARRPGGYGRGRAAGRGGRARQGACEARRGPPAGRPAVRVSPPRPAPGGWGARRDAEWPEWFPWVVPIAPGRPRPRSRGRAPGPGPARPENGVQSPG